MDFLEIWSFAQNHYILVASWCGALLWLVWLQINLWIDNLKTIQVGQAISLTNGGESVFLDVRNSDEYQKSHILGAKNIQLSTIEEKKFGTIEKYKSLGVVVVGKDFDDPVAYNCAKILKRNKFLNVYLLDGGMANWLSNNLPVTKE